MSKFKVGDKFLVVDAGDHYSVKNGDVVSLHEDDGSWVKYYENKDGGVVLIADDRLKPLSTTNTLQVGETYTSENGGEWDCIFVRDGKAWMVGVYSGDATGFAYVFDIDGTASWAGYGGGGYNIKWGPKRETVTIPTTHIVYKSGTHRMYDGHSQYEGAEVNNMSITFDIIDGTTDWTTAKVTPCD